MDHPRVAGVRPLYAVASWFRAGIDPSRPAHRLARDAAGRLYAAVRSVLDEAIAAKGTTVPAYRTGTGVHAASARGDDCAAQREPRHQPLEIADRAVVLRRGRTVGELVPSEETHRDMVSLIVGGAL